jgi:predicted NUDIX family phosphoesterase/dephospho-CoA kinase
MRAERDDEYKQVLTYIMVTRRGKLLSFARGAFNRVEDYLRGSRCVGFGGHLTANDRSLFSSRDQGLLNSAARELSEELDLPDGDRARLQDHVGLRIVGCINDDSSAVGRRHFAFVMRYEVSGDPRWDQPTRGEKSITQLKWLDPADVGIGLWQYEYWSQLCLRLFYSSLVRAQPWYRVIRATAIRPRHVLCVIGQIGSGKSEATEVLVKDHGYVEVNSGKVLAGILGLRPVTESTRARFQVKAQKFIRRKGSPERLARAMWKATQKAGGDRVVIDGIRQRATLEAMRALAGNRGIGILYVYAPADVAFRFYRMRAHNASVGDFIRVREAPVEVETASLIGLADAVLYNWTGRRAYRAMIGRLMKAVSA